MMTGKFKRKTTKDTVPERNGGRVEEGRAQLHDQKGLLRFLVHFMQDYAVRMRDFLKRHDLQAVKNPSAIVCG